MSEIEEPTRNEVMKIAAIKAVRETLDIGLREAKDAVEAAIARYRPDAVTEWGGKAMMLVSQGECLRCHATFNPGERGNVYCSMDCFEQAREDNYNASVIATLDQEVRELEERLAAAKVRASDARDRRAGF